jgi:hypothetical protein
METSSRCLKKSGPRLQRLGSFGSSAVESRPGSTWWRSRIGSDVSPPPDFCCPCCVFGGTVTGGGTLGVGVLLRSGLSGRVSGLVSGMLALLSSRVVDRKMGPRRRAKVHLAPGAIRIAAGIVRRGGCQDEKSRGRNADEHD